MPDEQVAEQGPLAGRDKLLEVSFDSFGRRFLGEPEAVRQSGDVGVHDDALVEGEGISENHVGRLAPDTPKLNELFHGAWHLPAVLFYEGSTALLNAFRFIAKESCGFDRLFQLGVGRRR